MFEKYCCDVGSSFSRRIDKEYNFFGISFSIAKIWLFLIKWCFKYIIVSQFPLSFNTDNSHELELFKVRFWVNWKSLSIFCHNFNSSFSSKRLLTESPSNKQPYYQFWFMSCIIKTAKKLKMEPPEYKNNIYNKNL